MLDGPGELPPPKLAPTTGVDAHAPETDLPQPELVWRFEDDVVERESRAVTSYGSVYDAPFGARVSELYDGAVGVSQDDPALAWARARTEYRIAWPVAEVRTEATLDVSSDADAYHVVVDLVAEEPAVASVGSVAGSGRPARFA